MYVIREDKRVNKLEQAFERIYFDRRDELYY